MRLPRNRKLHLTDNTFAGILEETESEPSFSPLVRDHLCLLLKEFKSYFPTTKYPWTAKEWSCYPIPYKPRESNMSGEEEDQMLEITNNSGFKRMLKTTALSVFWIKLCLKTLRLPRQHWKPGAGLSVLAGCHFWKKILSVWSKSFLQWKSTPTPLWVSFPITPRWDVLLQRNKLRATTDSALWWVVFFVHFILVFLVNLILKAYHCEQRVLQAERMLLMTHLLCCCCCGCCCDFKETLKEVIWTHYYPQAVKKRSCLLPVS